MAAGANPEAVTQQQRIAAEQAAQAARPVTVAEFNQVLQPMAEHIQRLERAQQAAPISPAKNKEPISEPVAPEPKRKEPVIMATEKPKEKVEAFSLKKTSEKWGKGIKEFFKKEPVKLGILAGLAGFTALTWNPLFAPLFAGLAVKFPIIGTIAGSIGGFFKGIPAALSSGVDFARQALIKP